MIKKVNYFFQTVLFFLFFFLGRILGIKLSRKIFAFLFSYLGPFIKSKKVVNNNLHTFDKKISESKKNQIIDNMWKNYGMTFIE